MNTIFDITLFGAKGDGTTDDTGAIQAAVMAALGCCGAVLIPPGRFKITAPISFPFVAANLSIFGMGSNVSRILAHGCSGLEFEFAMDEAQQPYGVNLRDFAIVAVGACPKAVRISYGEPTVISDHDHAGPSLENIQIVSNAQGAWEYGIVLKSAWNCTLTNVWVSGDSFGGKWGELRGAGLLLRDTCVNTHLNSCRFNYFADGVLVECRMDGVNSEGLFIANCSMVGVQRGVTIMGNPHAPAARMSTLTMTGGLIECRVGGVGPEIVSAGVYLTHVWTALITGVQILTEALPPEGKVTYGILGIDCAGVVATGCDLNAVLHGFHIGGESKSCCCSSTTFTNCKEQVVYAPNTIDSRSYGNVRFNDPEFEWSWSDQNKIGFVN